MQVQKQSGELQDFDRAKVEKRLKSLTFDLNTDYVDVEAVAEKVEQGAYDKVKTSDLDALVAETCAYMSQNHPDYSFLAARIAISRLHKDTSDNYMDVVDSLYKWTDPTGKDCALLSDEFYDVVKNNQEKIQAAFDYKQDFFYDYFGFKTLEKAYLLRVKGKIVERPQHMLMRCAIGIHFGDLERALETYKLISDRYFTHATPTLYNAGTKLNQMSSCFLLSMKSDSIEGIFETLKRTALISKSAGGIGVAISNIRASGSYIRGTNGQSNGLVPMLRVFNDAARYVDQGGGRRKGSFAMYLEPWHADVFDFLELRKNHGKEEMRARDLFYALWIPDLFMKRVMEGGDWTLFCPDEASEVGADGKTKTLQDAYGEEFEELYKKLEAQGKGKKTVKAQALWTKVMESQMETGTPYMCYKDHANKKSNQKNIGTIRCSNLCTEIMEFTSPDEVAVCNLASIALPRFVENGKFEFKKLFDITKVITRNLNRVIDRNYYPVEEARRSNMKHRPIGLGVQGLADVFMKMKLPFESEQAGVLNKQIFETIYFAACTMSMELAKEEGHYETFPGSPASQGLLQPDLWNVKPDNGLDWNWDELRENVKTHGLRNSLLLAPMPTASTAQILGNNEAIEPYTQNIYVRRVLSGEFVQVNRHLLADLVERKLWNDDLKNQLIAHNGSLQNIEVPKDLKELYKTVWEIKQKRVIEMAAERGAYIDQSQSLNIHMTDCTMQKLSSMHFYGWKLGLKTGQYYLRTKAAVEAIKFTVDQESLKKKQEDMVKEQEAKSKYECVGCGS
mmetsp:Transcript_28578/g.72433  ORF Transcript_28578/g.72433 Transcript_28578/m.72433 type:complete len:790 (+) Transcript_28578:179-2548(+)